MIKKSLRAYITIGQVAQRMHLTTHTLRYYEKEGLLPQVARNESGIRRFRDEDLERLRIIECLKATGMPIRDIRLFVEWCAQGDATLQQRYDMFLERRAEVLRQIADLQTVLETIDYKCWYYQTALEAGTEAIHKTGSVLSQEEQSYQRQDRPAVRAEQRRDKAAI